MTNETPDGNVEQNNPHGRYRPTADPSVYGPPIPMTPQQRQEYLKEQAEAARQEEERANKEYMRQLNEKVDAKQEAKEFSDRIHDESDDVEESGNTVADTREIPSVGNITTKRLPPIQVGILSAVIVSAAAITPVLLNLV